MWLRDSNGKICRQVKPPGPRTAEEVAAALAEAEAKRKELAARVMELSATGFDFGIHVTPAPETEDSIRLRNFWKERASE
jgi:hypothetical protein